MEKDVYHAAHAFAERTRIFFVLRVLVKHVSWDSTFKIRPGLCQVVHWLLS